MDKIRGRGSYRNRKPCDKDFDQTDGSHNLQINETQINNIVFESISTIEESEIDENDFWLHHNKDYIPRKNRPRQESPMLFDTSQQEPVAILRSCNKVIVATIIVVATCSILHWRSPVSELTVKNHNLQFSTDVKQLARIYNLTKDTLLKIKVGVNTIHDDKSAGSFTILYNSGEKNFQKRLFNEIVKAIATVTATYLRHGNGSFIELESNNLKMANHEDLMQSYDSTLFEKGVMLVNDLDNLPTNLAMAFHYFCDEFDPLVRKSAIFFTIDKQKCSIQSDSEPHKWIEKCLAKKWRRDMRDDIIFPLLARVIDVVVEI